MSASFKRVQLSHAPPSWVKSGSLFFVTICCEEKRSNVLCHPDVADSLFSAVRFYNENSIWFTRLFLLMPDHCHALISFPRSVDMTKVVGNWKRYTAKKLSIKWQENFFDHRIRNGESWEVKASYIRMNPVRKGLVEEPQDWPWILENG